MLVKAAKWLLQILQQPVSILFGLKSEFMMTGGMNVVNKKKYDNGELTEAATIRKFRIVQTEGSRQVMTSFCWN